MYKIIFLIALLVSPVTNATVIETDGDLLKFKFTGVGELIYSPSPHVSFFDMSLEFLLDTRKLPVNVTSGDFHGDPEYHGLLARFDFLSLISNVRLNLNGVKYNQESINANFIALAVNDTFSFWENTVIFSLGGKNFVISQWNRSGQINYETFISSPGALFDYYSDITGDVNGIWGFREGDAFYGGGFTSFAISKIPESSMITLMGLGLMGFGFSQRKNWKITSLLDF